MTGTHAGFIYNFYSINTMKRTKINWYELKEGIHLYIDGRIFKKIIEKGIKKSGSLSKLCIELNSNHFYRILKEEINGTSIKRLKMLLDFLNIKYDKINPVKVAYHVVVNLMNIINEAIRARSRF